jgi:hypothetical protein
LGLHGLIEVTNLHYRELVDGLLEGKTVVEAFFFIARDTTLGRIYLDKLRTFIAVPHIRIVANLTHSRGNSRRRSLMPGSMSGAE